MIATVAFEIKVSATLTKLVVGLAKSIILLRQVRINLVDEIFNII